MNEQKKYELEDKQTVYLPVNFRSILFFILIISYFFTHFYGLGVKPMHHDESIHANNSYNLFEGRGYRYDPVYHGPFLYYATAFIFYLCGTSDVTARFAPALCGMGIFVVLLLLIMQKKWLKDKGIWVLVLLLLSPTMTYFSRFLRMDIFSCFFAVLLFYGALNYLQEFKTKHFILMSVALALLYCTKENCHITAFIFCSFPLVYGLWYYVRQRREKEGSILQLLTHHHVLVKGIFIFGMIEATIVVLVWLRLTAFFDELKNSMQNALLVLVATLLVSLLLAGFYFLERYLVKSQPKSISLFTQESFTRNEPLYLGLMVFTVLFVLFYTNFLNYPNRLADGLLKGLEYWMGQQGEPRIPGPFLYYIPLILIYELPLLFIIVSGVVQGSQLFKKCIPVVVLITGWILSSESFFGSEFPLVTKLLGLSTWELAVVILVIWVTVVGLTKFLRENRSIDAFLLYWSVLAFFLYGIANEKVPWLATHLVLPQILLAGSILSRYFQSKDFILNRIVTLVLLVISLSYMVHSNLTLNFHNESDPRETMVYVQSHTDVQKVRDHIFDLIYRQGKDQPVKIIVDDDATWPFAWYLRGYNAIFLPTINRVDAPIVITSDKPSPVLVTELIENGFIGRKYRLRAWWQPDWNKLFSRSWKEIFVSLRKYMLYRKTFGPEIGSSDFMFFFKAPWSEYEPKKSENRQTLEDGPQTADNDDDAVIEIPDAFQETAGKFLREIGKLKRKKHKLKYPKDVEIGPDNNVYVVDLGHHRIQIYDYDGKWLSSIGREKGSDEGEFNDPQGIAVNHDGTIYVADTWNHRIQQFTKDGEFVRIFGQNLGMWGPRDVEISSDNEIYVVDTGRTLVRVFSMDGKKLREWGFRGSTEGKLLEPVGIAFNSHDEVSIADCGNKRIQIFSQSGTLIRYFSVMGWENYYAEPYLAVDPENRIYATDPTNNRILIYSEAGQLLKTIGIEGEAPGSLSSPKGITIGPENSIIVADSQNNRVQVFNSPF